MYFGLDIMKEVIENKIMEIFLFCSSYTPLFLILLVKYFHINDFLSLKSINDFCNLLCASDFQIFIISLVVIIISNIMLYLKINSSSELSKLIYVDKVENRTFDILTYSMPFILTILSLPLIKSEILSLFLIFIFIFFIYRISDMVLLNPVLPLFKYRFYHVYCGNYYFVVLTKEDLRKYIGKSIEIKIIDMFQNPLLF